MNDHSCIERQLGVIITTQKTQGEQIAELSQIVKELKDDISSIKIELAEGRGARRGASAIAGIIGGLIGAGITIGIALLEFLK